MSDATLPRLPDEPRGFVLAFALAATAALAAATLLPAPTPPRLARMADAPQPSADRAAATLERAAAARPMDAEALRRLADQLRASHRPLQLAAALERLHLLTGEPAPLREAMQLRDQLGDAAAARAALERLSALGATTAAEAIRLADLRMEAGDAAGAVAGLLQAIARDPAPELALRTVRAAGRLADPARAMLSLGALLGEVAPDLLEALRRVLMSDGRPDLALFLLEGLPAPLQAQPGMAFALAQAEARAGWTGAALTRLSALRATDGLPPGAGALLIEVALRENRLEDAFSVAALLPAEAWPPGLPLRLREAARDDPNGEALLRRIDPARLAARPEAAAVIALARGDRAAARRFATQALDRPPSSWEGARDVAAVLRELGQDGAAQERLRREATAPRPDPAALRLFAELSAQPPRRAAALPVLERLRDGGPAAGEAWLRLALAEGRYTDAATFLRGGGNASGPALTEALMQAVQRRDAALAEAAAGALRALPALPEGWTAEDVAVTAALARPLSPAVLLRALDLLDWAAEAQSRNRIVLLLAAAPEIRTAGAAAAVAQHPAIGRLRREAEAGTPGEATTARLALLAVLAPQEAVPLLTRRADIEPGRFGVALVLARLRGEGEASGLAALRSLLPRLPRAQQDQVLHLVLAAAPAATQPALRRMAEELSGPDWRRAYEATLERQGRLGALRQALRQRAAVPGTTAAEKREIAVQLSELGDADGAVAVMGGEEAP